MPSMSSRAKSLYPIEKSSTGGRLDKTIQDITDEHIKSVDELARKKEEDLLKV